MYASEREKHHKGKEENVNNYNRTQEIQMRIEENMNHHTEKDEKIINAKRRTKEEKIDKKLKNMMMILSKV